MSSIWPFISTSFSHPFGLYLGLHKKNVTLFCAGLPLINRYGGYEMGVVPPLKCGESKHVFDWYSHVIIRHIEHQKSEFLLLGEAANYPPGTFSAIYQSQTRAGGEGHCPLWTPTTCPRSTPFTEWNHTFDWNCGIHRTCHGMCFSPILFWEIHFQDAFKTKLQVDFTKLQFDLRYSKATSRAPRHFEVNTKSTWRTRNRHHETPSQLVQSKLEAEAWLSIGEMEG